MYKLIHERVNYLADLQVNSIPGNNLKLVLISPDRAPFYLIVVYFARLESRRPTIMR